MRIYDINPTDGTVIAPAGREAPLDPMRETPRIPRGATDIEPLADIAQRKRREIATALADALAGGMRYTMPDGSEDTVQMLAEDRQNLLGLAIESRDLKAAGETGAVQEFRAKSNTRYPMTPEQTIALTDAALGHYKKLKAQSWDCKDAIAAALKAEDRAALEAIGWSEG